MINKVILIGNLGRDPEIRQLESGSSVAKFSIATNENYKDRAGEWQTVTEWHNIVAWRALAERVQRELKKGSLVYVEGKLTTRKWQDKDGNDRYTTEVVANVLRGLDKRESSGGGYGDNFPSTTDEPPAVSGGNSSAFSTPQTKTSQRNTSETMDDDDLPF